MPDPVKIAAIDEPWIEATILTPDEYLGAVLKLCQDRRGTQKELTYVGNRALVIYDLPLNEVVFDFYDRLKSVSKGYASFDYHLTDYKPSDLVKLQMLVNRREPHVRRRGQGDAVVEGGRRHGPVHGGEPFDAGGGGERRPRAGVPRVGGGVFRGQTGAALRRLPGKAAEAGAGGRKPITERPGGAAAAGGPGGGASSAAAGRPAAERPRPDDAPAVPARVPGLRWHQAKYSDTSVLPMGVYFYGMQPGEEMSVDIEAGKTLIVKFLTVGDPHEDGRRLVFFELNGQPREVLVQDRKLLGAAERTEGRGGQSEPRGGADAGAGGERGGVPGEEVVAGQKLVSLEAMKMETTVYAEKSGRIGEVLVRQGLPGGGG